MAYVLWRVFMKKYSKVRLGIHRSPLPAVTPTGRHVRTFDESSWQVRDDNAPEPATLAADKSKKSDASDDFSRNSDVRKSKTKRVKNYLKRCKDVALGNSSASSGKSQEKNVEKPPTDARSSWYIQNDTKIVETDTSNQYVTVVTIDNDIWETVEDLQPTPGVSNIVQNCDQNEVSKEETDPEQPTSEIVTDLDEAPSPESYLTPEDCLQLSERTVVSDTGSCVPRGEDLSETSDDREVISVASEDVVSGNVQESSPNLSSRQVDVEEESADPVAVEDVLPRCAPENKCDVASLVDKLLGPLYPNFENTRPMLVRQARDLLVCEYVSNLARFEVEFCVPAAALLRHVKEQAQKQKTSSTANNSNQSENNEAEVAGDIACAPDGWPLGLGASGICLHLGALPPTLLRHGDCYLCVRGRSAPGLEVALVWRNLHTIGSQMLAEFLHPLKPESSSITCTGFQSITDLEMAAALTLDEDPGIVRTGAGQELPQLLQNLLVSVEHAIERVPLDDLAFPCPQCLQYLPLIENIEDGTTAGSCSCQCVCQLNEMLVKTQDTSIQNSPMFEFANSIPHIDSDEDSEDYSKGTPKSFIGSIGKKDLPAPKNITDLPEKLLMSGINLPGTHDTHGRPIVLCDAACIARAGLNRYDVTRLLLYYASIITKNKIENEVTILVLAETSEEEALDVLDKAIVTLTPKLKVNRIIVWRPSADIKKNKGLKTLKSSKLKCNIVTEESSLEGYISKEQSPASCGGTSSHDQLEWVEFYKECEPFLNHCHTGGRMLAAAMAEIRNNEMPTIITRRHLNHQHRQLTRALMNPDLVKLRREGSATLERLEERAQWLTGSEDVQITKARARRCFEEVHRVARRLEQLTDQRRERLRELARLRALEEETSEVLKWLREIGQAKLKGTAALQRAELDIDAIREKEKDFEQFYFVAMRYMDKGSDLLEEANQCLDPRANNFKDLAQTLKIQLRAFGEALEEAREYFEDVSKYYQLMERLSNVDDPQLKEDFTKEMARIARKLGDEKLVEKCKAFNEQACAFGFNSPTHHTSNSHIRSGLLTSTPIADEKSPHGGSEEHTRRRSISSFAFIYRCNHHAAGFPCNCWDVVDENNISQKLKNSFVHSLQNQKCICKDSSIVRQNSLGLCNIKEVRESTENLLDNDSTSRQDDKNDSGLSGCGRCDSISTGKSRTIVKKRLHRTCSCKYFGTETCGICSVTGSSSGSGSNADHNEQQADNMTEGGGSDDFTKSSGCDDHENPEEQFRGKTIPPVPVNSHLHCHSSNLHLPSTAPTMDAKTQKTLLLIMREMIQTERDYVSSLDYIIENYIPELLREDIPQALRGQRNVVFGNVEKIYEFHSQHFLRELEQKADNPLQVGQCFLRHEHKFYLYALYNKNKPKSDSLMSEYGTIFFKSKQVELEDKMDLASYLLKPVQRMGKYALLLQQLMKACPPLPVDIQEREYADIEDLRSAEQMVRFQLRHGNDLLAMDSLRDCDVNLKEQGRLLRQNEFLVGEGRGGKKHIRQVFLFEELILFSKANRFPDRKNLDLYIYKNSIKMSDIGLTEKIGDSATKFEIWFRKRKRNDTFVLQAMSEDVKKAWTEEISQLLWKQAMKNREVRLQEMSSMGIGNKPCLDIRPSADQISDRSISIAQLSKTPRFRNSIAGPIVEPCRSSKRPHSIISVSSVSSGSTSSGGSAGTLGRHHPAQSQIGDPAASPKTHHRSTLNSQCSTESGILADISLSSEEFVDSCTTSHWPLHKSNSQQSTSSSKSTTIASPQTEEPQVTLYHVPDELSINL